tara:strand:+ start:525 stop:1463 length:939 start_codon:yes stop_codon:yes gene_type:complete
MVGCEGDYSNIHRQHHYQILSAVGKIAKDQHSSACKLLSSGLTATLINESVSKEKNGFYDLHYQAYEISYTQYQQYIALLEAIQGESTKPLRYYFVPNFYDEQAPADQTKFMHSSATTPAQKPNKLAITPDIKNQHTTLAASNTCRHTSLALLKQAGVTDPSLSTSWLGKLTNRMFVANGKIKSPLFIRPASITVEKHQHPEHYQLLNKLRGGIIALANSRYSIELAVHKANALRDLYNKLNSSDNSNQAAVRDIIEDWKHKTGPSGIVNAQLIEERRRSYCLSLFNPKQSTSTKLVASLLPPLPPANSRIA